MTDTDKFYGGPLNGCTTEMDELPDGVQVSHPGTGAMYERAAVMDEPGVRAWNYLDLDARLKTGYGLHDGAATVRVTPQNGHTCLTLDELIDFVDACAHARVPGDTIITARVDFNQRIRWVEANPTNVGQPKK